MESSISFWTNSLLKMMSSYVFITGTKLSVIRYFPLPSFINIIPFATSRWESKEGRHLYLNHSPYTHTCQSPLNYSLLYSLLNVNSWLSSVSPIMPPRYPDLDLFYSHPLLLFLYYRFIESTQFLGHPCGCLDFFLDPILTILSFYLSFHYFNLWRQISSTVRASLMSI